MDDAGTIEKKWSIPTNIAEKGKDIPKENPSNPNSPLEQLFSHLARSDPELQSRFL
jgi:hypothetical protein